MSKETLENSKLAEEITKKLNIESNKVMNIPPQNESKGHKLQIIISIGISLLIVGTLIYSIIEAIN